MMKKQHIVILLICLLLTGGVEAKTSLDLSLAGVGARPLAMGRAFTAVADDANALFLNPAGLGGQKDWEITSMSSKLMGIVDYKMAGAVCPTNYGTFGVGYLAVLTPGGFQTGNTISAADASYQPITYGSNVLVLSYGRDLSDLIKTNDSLGRISVGASLKSFASHFDGTDGSASGTSASLGLLFKPNQVFSYGVSLHDAGGSINWKSGTKEDLPAITSFGTAYNFSRGLVSLDLDYLKGNSQVHGGLEYQPINNVTVRAGLDSASVAGGVGVKIAGIGFDYTYRQDSALSENTTHYVSISIQPQEQPKKIVDIAPNLTPIDDIYPQDGIYRHKKITQDKNILKYYENKPRQDGIYKLSKKKEILSYFSH